MKKIFALIAAMVFAAGMYGQSYGILVNGKIYYAADYKGADEAKEGFEEYLAHVQVSKGDYCQLYDPDNKTAWAKPLNTYSVAGFAYDQTNDRYTVTVDGCYDFYIKIKYNADELYIGPGTVTCGEGQDISGGTPVNPGYSGSVPAKCPDVMLQAFYWESYQDPNITGSATKVYGRTKWADFKNGKASDGITRLAEEMGQWFDLIWLPPMSNSSGGVGYHPKQYSNMKSDWGEQQNLKTIITTFHENGARVVADIVINHAEGQNGWCDFPEQNFGTYGKFSPKPSWICQTDEMNWDEKKDKAGYCYGKATGANDDGYGSEANYPDARDWDHTNAEVQNMFKAYLKWLRGEMKIDGFRYDYCKGYKNSHINDYNKAAEAYFSVMEFWDGNVNTLQYHLGEAGWNTLTFDFATKYTAFNDGIAKDNYCALKGAGLLGAGKGRYACTFLDSHDSFLRQDQYGNSNEFMGYNNSMNHTDKVMQCYAYLLSMPGVPCVFYPHWVAMKDQIKAMINARYKTGVHSESSVSDDCGNGSYTATITGTNGQIRLLIGPNSGYNTTPAGFTLAAKGNGYGVYYKTNSARGDKNTERVDRTKIQGVELTPSESSSRGEKVLRDGKLLIKVGEQVFDAFGRRVQ